MLFPWYKFDYPMEIWPNPSYRKILILICNKKYELVSESVFQFLRSLLRKRQLGRIGFLSVLEAGDGGKGGGRDKKRDELLPFITFYSRMYIKVFLLVTLLELTKNAYIAGFVKKNTSFLHDETFVFFHNPQSCAVNLPREIFAYALL